MVLLTLKLLLAAIFAAGVAVAQNCEFDCLQTLTLVSGSCSSCTCEAYDHPDYVRCMTSKCGSSYKSIRKSQALTCAYMGVSISPDVPSSPATSGGVSSATGTVDAATEATSSTSAGSGSSTSGSGSSNSASGGSPSGSSDKNGLSPAELAGIIIGAVGSVAGVAAVWVGIKQLKNKRHGRDASEAAQGFLSENQPRNTIHIAPTFNMPTTPQYNPIPPPYHSGYIYGRSA